MTTIHQSDNATDGAQDTRNPYSERLEYVRKVIAGIEDVRNFLRALGYEELDPDDPEFISYESARRYHKDRTPPIDYLVRVSHRFPEATIQFLTTGDVALAKAAPAQTAGSAFYVTADIVAKGKWDAMREEFPIAIELKGVRDAILSAGESLSPAYYELPGEDIQQTWTRMGGEEARSVAKVARVFRMVLEELGVNVNSIYVGQLEQFANLIAMAIKALEPNKAFGRLVGEVHALRPATDGPDVIRDG